MSGQKLSKNLYHDYEIVSETESESLVSQSVYTPSTSDDLSTTLRDEHTDTGEEAVDEKARLLAGDALPALTPKSNCNFSLNPEVAKAARCQGFGLWKRYNERRKCRKICLFIFLKLVLLVGGFMWLGRLCYGRFHKSHWPGLHDCKATAFEVSATGSREIIVDNGARSIWGQFPLYDLLSLSTTSGSIAVTIMPQPADPENPDEPARISIRTKSGSVTVSFTAPEAAMLTETDAEMVTLEDIEHAHGKTKPTSKDKKQKKNEMKILKKLEKAAKKHKKHLALSTTKFYGCEMTTTPVNLDLNRLDLLTKQDPSSLMRPLPARPYEIDIHTEHGSIAGRFIFTSSLSLVADHGSISASLAPVVYPGSTTNASINTVTGSGSQHIRITEPVILHSGTGSTMIEDASPTASHISQEVGSLQISYPRSWAGKIDAHAEEGAICLEGRGLVVHKDGQGRADGKKEPSSSNDGDAPNWWGGKGDMDVFAESAGRGSIMFVVG